MSASIVATNTGGIVTVATGPGGLVRFEVYGANVNRPKDAAHSVVFLTPKEAVAVAAVLLSRAK